MGSVSDVNWNGAFTSLLSINNNQCCEVVLPFCNGGVRVCIAETRQRNRGTEFKAKNLPLSCPRIL